MRERIPVHIQQWNSEFGEFVCDVKNEKCFKTRWGEKKKFTSQKFISTRFEQSDNAKNFRNITQTNNQNYVAFCTWENVIWKILLSAGKNYTPKMSF